MVPGSVWTLNTTSSRPLESWFGELRKRSKKPASAGFGVDVMRAAAKTATAAARAKLTIRMTNPRHFLPVGECPPILVSGPLTIIAKGSDLDSDPDSD